MKAPKLGMKLGAEPKKTALLVALLVIAAYFLYTNVLSSPDSGPPAGRPRPVAKAVASLSKRAEDLKTAAEQPKESSGQKPGSRDFRPSLKPKKGEERSFTDINPTLRLDILARLEAVKIERVDRSLFDFGAAEPAKPKLPEPKIEVKKAEKRMIGPEPPPPPPPPPVKPPPPPINLKFFGNALPTRGGVPRVFCIQGDEILAPAEGDVIQRRYKIVKINANTVLVEDLDYKNQQTLRIEEPQAG